MPLAKYVALHYNELSFPFRRYQIGKVYRGERAQRGRFREFYQADIDIIGDGSLDRSSINPDRVLAFTRSMFSTSFLVGFYDNGSCNCGSSGTAVWISSTMRRSPPSSVRPLPLWA